MDIHSIATPEIIAAYNNLVVALMKETGMQRICFDNSTPIYNYAGITEARVTSDTLYFVDEAGNFTWIDFDCSNYWYWVDAAYKALTISLAQY